MVQTSNRRGNMGRGGIPFPRLWWLYWGDADKIVPTTLCGTLMCWVTPPSGTVLVTLTDIIIPCINSGYPSFTWNTPPYYLCTLQPHSVSPTSWSNHDVSPDVSLWNPVTSPLHTTETAPYSTDNTCGIMTLISCRGSIPYILFLLSCKLKIVWSIYEFLRPAPFDII